MNGKVINEQAAVITRLIKEIARVPLPEEDPVYGAEGVLLKHWNS